MSQLFYLENIYRVQATMQDQVKIRVTNRMALFIHLWEIQDELSCVRLFCGI